MKNIFLIVFLTFSVSLFAQVKIGENPSQININSLLELESSNKVLVLSRVSTIEMNLIKPLEGAVVYNLDEKCLFVFEGAVWKSLCDGGSDYQQLSFDSDTNILTLENGGFVDLSSLDNDGEQGPQGIQGEKGDKGDKGDTGDTGAQGP
ncbi:hypothetical protein ACFQ5N_12485, partial [Lutibacter holmesii]